MWSGESNDKRKDVRYDAVSKCDSFSIIVLVNDRLEIWNGTGGDQYGRYYLRSNRLIMIDRWWIRTYFVKKWGDIMVFPVDSLDWLWDLLADI